MLTKVISSWKGVVLINLVWIAWFLIYLFLWIPDGKTPKSLEGLWYGLSIVPFAGLMLLGMLGILNLFSKK